VVSLVLEWCSNIGKYSEIFEVPSMTESTFSIAIIGLGDIGRRHMNEALRSPHVRLAAVADPSPAAETLARAHNLSWFADWRQMLDATRVQAVIVATPNTTHADIGVQCLARGLPTLMEKPLADTLEAGTLLCQAARDARVPLLVGHHRRCNPIARRARELVQGGALGRAVSATVMSTWYKPEGYFALDWHRKAGAGPVLINLIHDIDLLRFVWGSVAGEITEVQANASSAVRGLEVEDTAAVLLRFANGALATMNVSDTAVAPWNWDLATGESAHFPQQAVDAFYLSGTEGAITLPRLHQWRYGTSNKSWHEPLTQERTAVHVENPYAEQLRHLRFVAEGREEALCSGEEGLRTLQATLAVHAAAQSAAVVHLAAQSAAVVHLAAQSGGVVAL